MKHEGIAAMHAQRLRDKKEGVKHSPLHTLAECCEAAGVTMQWFAQARARYPGAPEPALVSANKSYVRQQNRHYRKHEFVRWVKQIKEELATKKGTLIMPDIKTAMQTALEKAASTQAEQPKEIPADWDDEGGAAEIKEVSSNPATTKEQQVPKKLFQPTNNVSRRAFEFIRDNPGCTRAQYMESLAAEGFKDSSTSSLLSQMMNQGRIKGSAKEGYFVTSTDYKPVQAHKRFVATKVKAQAKAEKPEAVQQPAPTLAEKKAALLGGAHSAWSVTTALEGLSVLQARALYDELRKIFGDK